MKNIRLNAILVGLLLYVNLYAVVVNYSYDDSKGVQCPGRFIVNRSDSVSTVSMQGKSFYVPVDVYVDMGSKLMWMACPIGYDLDVNKTVCKANAVSDFDLASARTKAQDINNAVQDSNPQGLVYRDWHLPNVVELRSLYRHPACRTAISINTDGNLIKELISRSNYYNIYTLPSLLDGSSGTEYWSGTIVAGESNMAWSVNLETGITKKSDISSKLKVILVRKVVLP